MTGALQGSITRNEIDGSDDTLGALFPTQPKGVEFLQENNAWGFVTITREPEFVAIYVSGSEKAVQYFAKVNEIVDAEDAELAHPVEEHPRFESGKKLSCSSPRVCICLKILFHTGIVLHTHYAISLSVISVLRPELTNSSKTTTPDSESSHHVETTY